MCVCVSFHAWRMNSVWVCHLLLNWFCWCWLFMWVLCLNDVQHKHEIVQIMNSPTDTNPEVKIRSFRSSLSIRSHSFRLVHFNHWARRPSIPWTISNAIDFNQMNQFGSIGLKSIIIERCIYDGSLKMFSMLEMRSNDATINMVVISFFNCYLYWIRYMDFLNERKMLYLFFKPTGMESGV